MKGCAMNEVVNVILFKDPDMFVEFGRVSVLCVL